MAGCAPIGSGNIVTETRDVDTFDSVDVESGIRVDLVVDPAADKGVEVVYDDNLQERIVLSVEDGVLHVDADGNLPLFGTEGRQVRVVTPGLVALTMSGGAQVDAAGTVASLDLRVSGGANAGLEDLIVSNLVVDMAAGAKAHVHATDAIEGEVTSGASLTVDGDPAVVNVSSSAGGNIEY
jgi:hypothetical protein